MEQALVHEASRDHLTGAANRRAFDRSLMVCSAMIKDMAVHLHPSSHLEGGGEDAFLVEGAERCSAPKPGADREMGPSKSLSRVRTNFFYAMSLIDTVT
ncbi:hypothetical protein [Halomonas chromatireducens]|uniref:hypothetical protein n=1 Tax=Halomonas chromatireducens TaxID=507626 RepID=UPI00082F81E1|nr:hypothetical protein [Halomonas chromatireducens]